MEHSVYRPGRNTSLPTDRQATPWNAGVGCAIREVVGAMLWIMLTPEWGRLRGVMS